MSEPIREQISAFLDGELPPAETDLLLKRFARDAELRAYFGRCALIGEACRGSIGTRPMSRGVAARVQLAIEAEAPHHGGARVRRPVSARFWRHAASGAIAAGVAVFAVLALQQRADTPTLTASTSAGAPASPVVTPRFGASNGATFAAKSDSRSLSYTVPTSLTETPAALPPARLTNYVFAHSEYSSFLGQRGLLSGLIAEPETGFGPARAADAPEAAASAAASAPSIVPAGPSHGAASLPGGP